MKESHKLPSNNGVIFVLGMHRSGTSALAGCIAKLGVQTPSKLMPATPENPKGYWETFELMHIHDRLLESAHLDWSDVSPFPKSWYETSSAPLFKIEIQEFLVAQIDKNQLFLIKDPRICRIPEFWFDILSTNDIKAHAVFSLRNPLEVAESLKARDDIPIPIGCFLWLRHILDAEKSSRGTPRSFVNYDKLLSEPKEALVKVASDLNISWPQDNWHEVESFMEPGLRHHSVNKKGLTAEKQIAALVDKTYRVLSLLVDSPENPDAMHSLDIFHQELTQCDLLYNPALELKKQLIVKTKTQLTESKDSLSKLSSSYKWLTKKSQGIEERLKEQEQLRQKVEQQVTAKNEELSAKLKHIKALEKEKKSRDKELGKIKHSYIQAYKQFEPLYNEHQSLKNSKLSGIYSLLKALSTFTPKSKMRKESSDLKDLIAKSGLFDARWYLEKYPDIAASGLDALEHFLEYGLHELRDPGPGFSNYHYITNNPDLINSGMPPLKHYILIGASESRIPTPD